MSRPIYSSESFILPSFFKDVFRGNVASFLSAKDVIRFAKTSRIGRKIADHEWVWQQLSIRDFPRYIERKRPRVSWKKYYRYFYLRNSETFRA
ncbi:MAG: hypothetical protein K940chlam1_01236, partial [Candidatus Anoxychlamydiales bacterium]|nr:hypothetical protein [Candidatus Anoxychlamydiales bacterium]